MNKSSPELLRLKQIQTMNRGRQGKWRVWSMTGPSEAKAKSDNLVGIFASPVATKDTTG